jgi:hypothetical protein
LLIRVEQLLEILLVSVDLLGFYLLRALMQI